MQLTTWKRTVLAGLLTLSVAGGTFAPLVAGHAAARNCYIDGHDGTRVCVPSVP